MTIDRRRVIAAGLGTAALLATRQAIAATPIDGGRPPLPQRRFTSPAVEQAILRIGATLSSSPLGRKLAAMTANCLPNTLDTTVDFTPGARPDTFVITGDIDAMWLRDSTAQVWPYLGLTEADPRLGQLIAGVIDRQTRCVLIDPYANAFYKDASRRSEWASDHTEMRPGVHERKWELDSLCSVIRLAHGYWQVTHDRTPFDDRWREASHLIVATMQAQQRKLDRGPYHFQRDTGSSTDRVPGGGWGNPIRPVGLVVSLFRPSDDATILPFLVPSNMYAAVSLRRLAAMHEALFADHRFARTCRGLAREIEQALHRHARLHRAQGSDIWAYEVDGLGNRRFMDDANVPSLVSLPYLGWCGASDRLYRRTRQAALGADNRYFYAGRIAAGIGSPHTPPDRIWPIAIAMRAMTSEDAAEIRAALGMLATTDAGTGFMHEAFDADDPAQFSRPWFAWANSLFGELMLHLADRRPELLRDI